MTCSIIVRTAIRSPSASVGCPWSKRAVLNAVRRSADEVIKLLPVSLAPDIWMSIYVACAFRSQGSMAYYIVALALLILKS